MGSDGRIVANAVFCDSFSLSGNMMLNSTIISPLSDEFLGKGNPSPAIRLFEFGLIVSRNCSVTVFPDSVGIEIRPPHSA